MEKVEGVNLNELVAEASKELFAETNYWRRRQAAGLIKKLLQQREELASDVKRLEKDIQREREALENFQVKIDKIKAGDWSLLATDDGGE